MENIDPIAQWTKKIASEKPEIPADQKNRPMTAEELAKKTKAEETPVKEKIEEEQLEISF